MHGAAPLAEWLCLLLLCWTRGQILAQVGMLIILLPSLLTRTIDTLVTLHSPE